MLSEKRRKTGCSGKKASVSRFTVFSLLKEKEKAEVPDEIDLDQSFGSSSR